jgi:hypothetical protein
MLHFHDVEDEKKMKHRQLELGLINGERSTRISEEG